MITFLKQSFLLLFFFSVSTYLILNYESIKYNKSCLRIIELPETNKNFMKVIEDTSNILEELETDYSVFFGTLLHFYRSCALPKDTGDIDFILPYKQITQELINTFKNNGYKLLYTFGQSNQPGFEVSFIHPSKIKVDIFGEVEYTHYNWSPLWVQGKLHKCRYPKTYVKDLYISIARKLKIKVREPIEGILSSLYGHEWREPIETKKWNWINPRCTP